MKGLQLVCHLRASLLQRSRSESLVNAVCSRCRYSRLCTGPKCSEPYGIGGVTVSCSVASLLSAVSALASVQISLSISSISCHTVTQWRHPPCSADGESVFAGVASSERPLSSNVGELHHSASSAERSPMNTGSGYGSWRNAYEQSQLSWRLVPRTSLAVKNSVCSMGWSVSE
jgi:hypothetical protein